MLPTQFSKKKILFILICFLHQVNECKEIKNRAPSITTSNLHLVVKNINPKRLKIFFKKKVWKDIFIKSDKKELSAYLEKCFAAVKKNIASIEKHIKKKSQNQLKLKGLA